MILTGKITMIETASWGVSIGLLVQKTTTARYIAHIAMVTSQKFNDSPAFSCQSCVVVVFFN
jgi:hypothetical protein